MDGRLPSREPFPEGMAVGSMRVKTENLSLAGAICAGLAVLCLGGCFFGETYPYKTIEAEYMLKSREEGKILVLVKEPVWLSSSANIRYNVTEQMIEYLVKTVGISEVAIISHSRLIEYRSSTADYASLSPGQVGQNLGADTVLFISLSQCEVSEVAQAGLFDGSLSGSAVLVDSESSGQLWPVDEKRKTIKVGFDADAKTAEEASRKLAGAFAHCTGRFLYDCAAKHFMVIEDRSDNAWENWNY